MLCILLPSQNCTKDASQNKLPTLPFKENYKLYIRGYSPLCSYLRTKESYDRWVTRRVWGFKHQISKAKNIKMLVANIGKLQENTYALCKMAAKFLRQKEKIFATKG